MSVPSRSVSRTNASDTSRVCWYAATAARRLFTQSLLRDDSGAMAGA